MSPEALGPEHGDVKDQFLTELGRTLSVVDACLERDFPDEWRLAYPRVYEDVGGWFSPKAAACDFVRPLWHFRFPVSDVREDERQVLTVFGKAAQFRVPTFFLARDLAAALMCTRPAMRVEWARMRMPFEAGVVMLPRVDIELEDLVYLAYARLREGERVRLPGTSETFVADRDQLLLVTGERASKYGNYPATIVVRLAAGRTPAVLDLADEKALLADVQVIVSYGEVGRALEDLEREFVVRCLDLLFSVFLILEERPSYLEAGARRKAPTRKCAPEFWRPNVIGASYRIQREPLGAGAGGGSSPRMHWRRGHWRDQPCGPGWRARKHIWLEPTLVNAPVEDGSE